LRRRNSGHSEVAVSRGEKATTALLSSIVAIVVATIATLSFVDGRIERTAARAASDAIGPVRAKADTHYAEVEALRPVMLDYRDEERAARAALSAQAGSTNQKLDLLLQDCYRRGGCRP